MEKKARRILYLSLMCALISVCFTFNVGDASNTASAGSKIILKHTKGKDKSDLAAIRRMIKLQCKYGAKISKNMNNTQYVWNKNRRLTEINWTDCNLIGAVSVSGFKHLTRLICDYNEDMTSIDMTGCPVLNMFICGGNISYTAKYSSLTRVNVKYNKKLQYLYVPNNRLKNIDVSGNPKLRTLHVMDKKSVI